MKRASGAADQDCSKIKNQPIELKLDQAEAAVLRDWKHSRQKTGRPCVGRKGTVVCFPHPEQVAWVSTLV
jgi:hypothetical protein